MVSGVKRFLFSTVVLSLLAACASAPAATQDPAEIQQFIQDSVEATVSVVKAQATETQAPVATLTSSSGFQSVPDLGEAADSESPTTGPPPGPPPATPDVEEMAFDTYCGPVLETRTALGEIPGINKLESKLAKDQTAVVRHPVNLRTQPSRLNRILLILRPGTEVEVIDGPVRTRYDNGTRYVWWKVRLPGGLTGWAVELSACRQYYFMELDN